MALYQRFLSSITVSSSCESYVPNSNMCSVKEKNVCCKIQICYSRMNIFHKMFLSYCIKIPIVFTTIIFSYLIHYNNALATSHMAFSSYSGYLKSVSGFCIMDSEVAMLQTTNDIPNTTLHDLVTTNSLYVSATAGKEWYSYLSNQNSRTYSNQYMIINYAAFEIKESLLEDFVWVIDQIAGTVAGLDVTDTAKRGYWASYNAQTSEEMKNKSGHLELVANSVTDMESCKTIMRYNNNNPFWVLCNRGDLSSSSASPVVCYDAKVSNLSVLLNIQASALSIIQQ